MAYWLARLPGGSWRARMIGATETVQRPIDTIRQRWGFKQCLRDNSPESVDENKKAQELLIELGPTMVELGMLQP